MSRLVRAASVLVVFITLAGCGGGGGERSATPSLPDPATPGPSTEIGPFVIHTAGLVTVSVETIPHASGATFTAVHGGPMSYIGVQELLDRIVFSSFRSGNWDIWVCDLFGENLHWVAGTGHPDRDPTWSPDGSRIAFTQARESASPMEADIMVVSSSGGAVTNLTNSTDFDTHPTWSPSGDRIAFETNRAGNWEIYVMYSDGTGMVNLTNHAADDRQPDWSPDRTMGGIAFVSSRDALTEVYTMSPDGSSQTRVTTDSTWSSNPAWSPEGYFLAFCSYLAGVGSDVLEVTSGGTPQGALADSAYYEDYPSYSRDRRFLAYTSSEGGGFNIWVRQLEPPYARVRVTDGAGSDTRPDLGSPTVQTARVLVGPTGSDHGYDPVHVHAIAAVLVYDGEGYVNFVRLGIPPERVSTLQATPLEGTGSELVGVIWSAQDMYYVEQDEGLGVTPTIWDLSGQTSRSIALYLNAYTGRLVSILDLDDVLTAASGEATSGITHEVTGAATTIRGDFRRVWDAHGQLVAEGDIGMVQIDAAGRVSRAF